MSTAEDSAWRPVEGTYPNVFADAVVTPTWSAERIWASPSTLEADAAKPGTLCVAIGVEGSVVISSGGDTFELGEQQLCLYAADAPSTATATVPAARFEARFISARLSLPSYASLRGRPTDISEPFWQLAAATFNTLIVHPPSSDGAGSAQLRGLLEQLVVTLFADTHEAAVGQSPGSSEQLHAAAVRVIDARAGDPDFTVASLAAALAISQTHLHRVFTARGSTPRKAIEQARVQVAVAAMERLDLAGTVPLLELAQSSGFTSVRQMRAAVQRWS